MANVNAWLSQDGYITNPKLSEDTFKVAQPMMRARKYVQKLRVKGKFGGDLVNFPKFGNLDQEFTITPLTENVPIPESLQTVRQGTLVVDEWGRALPFSHKIEVLSDYNLDPGYREALSDHYAKTYNYRAAMKFKSTLVKYCPNNATVTTAGAWMDDGVIDLAALRHLNALDLRTIKNRMVDGFHTPPFKGSKDGPDFEFVFLAAETTISTLLADPEIREDLRFADMGAGQNAARISGKFPVWNGIVFVKDNQAFSTVIGTSAFSGEAVMFGRRPVVEVVAEAMNVRVKRPDDYGRSKGMAWYSIDGLALTWGDNTADVADNQVVVVHVTGT